ncbi:MAG TPA: hypothetical protein VJ775_07075 [Sphingomicrobium sp.]|nr:hypothetical protein [Sphingomicrobium sp.]
MSALRELIADELAQPVDPRATAMAEAIAAKHGEASRAVLFYGSCLRLAQLDGLMLDFYLIVSDYRAAYGKAWLAMANRLIPPNVFYFEHENLSAKYAVLSETDFPKFCSAEAPDLSVIARFSQPSRLVWVADYGARLRLESAIANAPAVLAAITEPMLSKAEENDPLDLWRRAFELTYGTELRAERKERPGSIVERDAGFYRKLTRALPELTDQPDGERIWKRYRRRGKRAQIMRLAKASFTFAGGADYIAWKINRHAGTEIQLKPWQRRWPLLAAISLLPRLLRTGAVR